ncbi:unnamed protein product [Arabis nemorensis]|uniref:Transcription initiation factor TFIID subunit 13 n=1 Tax=Arabis nemorensis TaxID=586526 RepID=A0A565B5E1_9BRAS|nr:unnamed protein product [Arabis nemorensis]
MESFASFSGAGEAFQKELQHMMYGFGDEPNPLPETVALVEDIVVEYVTNLVQDETIRNREIHFVTGESY